ncbi:hypothetical protein [Nonomuraea sp. NPDC050691]|uniref:single-stranded DNA-binding protein n=1 Tax=Nonomuraea sp. NPDC050691 TaxID=3155661 RepID=UPI0033E8A882
MDHNEVVLAGRVSVAAEDKRLPSGDTLTRWRLAVRRDRPHPKGGVMTDGIPCITFAPEVAAVVRDLGPDDPVEIRGAFRCRIYGPSSAKIWRYEVEVFSAEPINVDPASPPAGERRRTVRRPRTSKPSPATLATAPNDDAGTTQDRHGDDATTTQDRRGGEAVTGQGRREGEVVRGQDREGEVVRGQDRHRDDATTTQDRRGGEAVTAQDRRGGERGGEAVTAQDRGGDDVGMAGDRLPASLHSLGEVAPCSAPATSSPAIAKPPIVEMESLVKEESTMGPKLQAPQRPSRQEHEATPVDDNSRHSSSTPSRLQAMIDTCRSAGRGVLSRTSR